MNEQLELVIGIDFGHGEVAASYIDLVNGNGNPQFLNLNASSTNVKAEAVAPSLIYKNRNPDGTYSYSIDNQCGALEIELKGKINNEKERLTYYKKFIGLIYKRLINKNREILEDKGRLKNIQLYIAAPTRWIAEEKERYKEFIKEALNEIEENLGEKVKWIINESDAAFYSYNVVENSVVLVIDYGSSTIDYTLMIGDRKIDIDHLANQLGASHIEQYILNDYKNNKNTYDNYFRVDQLTRQELRKKNLDFINPDNHVKYLLRKEKERFYSADPEPYSFSSEFNLSFRLTNDNQYRNIDYVYEYKTTEIDNIIESYTTRVKRNLQNLKVEIDSRLKERGRTLDRIILTGGASRMKWFCKMVARVFFEGNECNITHDNSGASHAVSDGIVKYAVAQLKCLDSINAGIGEFRNDGTYLKVYKEARKATLQSMIDEPLRKICNEYANLERNAPVRELLDNVKRCFNDIFQTEEYKEELNRRMKKELIQRFSPKISDILKERLGIDNVAIDIDDFINRIKNVSIKEVTNSIPMLIEENIELMIDRCRNVNHKKDREMRERRKYADEIIKKFMNDDDGYFKLTKNDEQCINNQILLFEHLAMSCAQEIFYSNELFKTQFVG